MPIQILIGTESPLIEKEISRIKESVLQGGLSDFNFDSFSIREHAVETILAAANLFPMMGEKRLVLVRDISEIKAKDMEAWSAYFSNPSPTTCLLMVGEKIDKRLKAWQVANKAGFIRELKAPTGVQLTSWLVKEAQERNLSLSAQAAHLMTETLGDSLGSLLQALEKIALLITPRKEISLEDIRSVVGRFLSEDVFHCFTDTPGKMVRQKTSQLVRHSLIQYRI